MRSATLFFTLAATVVSWSVAAQASPAPASPTPTAGQRHAAEALLNTIYSEASFGEMVDKIVTTQVKANPQIARFEPEMRSFMHKYMSWAALKPDMVLLYAQEFTEPELVEITSFYKSPTGQKAAANLPSLMQKGMEIGQRHVQEHLPELEQLFKNKLTTEQPAKQ